MIANGYRRRSRLSLLWRRYRIVLAVAAATPLLILLVLALTPGTRTNDGIRNMAYERFHIAPADKPGEINGYDARLLQQCNDSNTASASLEMWHEAVAKYEHLSDTNFTVVIMAYKRPEYLQKVLDHLSKGETPSLLEIVVVWGDITTTPPGDYVSEQGITVRYRMATKDSLNEKLLPDPTYSTQAVLLSDDDIYYEPEDLEFVFQSWRAYGKMRMTGSYARCAIKDWRGAWKYTFCSQKLSPKKKMPYNLVLSNLAFTHIAVLDYYSSSDPTMTKVREYVDDNLNCEDIAMNHVTSIVTGHGPLLVEGREKISNLNPPKGISTRAGHMTARTKCVNDFTQFFGCMPLVNESVRIAYGA